MTTFLPCLSIQRYLLRDFLQALPARVDTLLRDEDAAGLENLIQKLFDAFQSRDTTLRPRV